MINELDEDDRAVVFKVIDTTLTKKKFKDFFQKNVATKVGKSFNVIFYTLL
ncbi:hypothetical protein [Mucilaginibacter sp.]|uniref:hypothetical protein n=1 Tax=Mucilaginibacter sp. TaxID=1882438 RepID=UPI003266726E